MRRIYIGVFLVSISALTLEVVLTRIISVKLWYHFSYLIISIALLGYGAAGAHLAVSKRFREKSGDLPLSRYAALFSIAALAGPLIACRIPFEIDMLPNKPIQWLSIPLYYLLFFLPFYFAGMVIVMALKQYRQEINRLYFFDLVGAGLGCMLAVFMIGFLGGPGTLAFASTLAALGSIVLITKPSSGLQATRWGLLAAAFILTVIFAVFSPQVIKTTKGGLKLLLSAADNNFKDIPTKHDFSRWGALTRIDVSPEFTTPPYVVMVGPERRKKLYKVRSILQDLTAETPMFKFSGDFDELPFLPYSAQASAYLGKSNPDVLVIGPGGGSGVMVALSLKARSVIAVEINPLTYRVLTRDYADYIGGIFHRPDVELINAEGRSYLARSQRKFDIIEMTFVDTFAALSSGAYSLSESYLYTIEAFEDVLDNLKADGVFACTRPIFSPPRESLRLMAIALETLSRMGVQEPWRHLYLLETENGKNIIGNAGTLLIKMDGFSPDETAQLDSFCRKEGFLVVYNPYGEKVNEFSAYAKSDEQGREAFRKQHMYEISPTTDDAPFFFQYFKWSQLLNIQGGKGNIAYKLPIGHWILLISLTQVIILSVIFILWPLRRFARKESTDAAGSHWGLLVYFAALGTGYMTIEIVLMQKLMVFLGYPLRSLTVVLFSLLLSSGIGSAVSRRWGEAPLKAIGVAMAAVIVLIPLELFITEKVFQQLMGWPATYRFIITAATLFPLGFVMGMPFPLGIRLMGDRYPDQVPWYWGINACFSVVSSLATVILSMSVGFRIAMLMAGVIYIVGYFGLRSGTRHW